MNIGIITINYKRPAVLNLYCAQIKRLREDLQMYVPAVVVSEAVDAPICNKYHVVHIEQQNNPATEKWNRAMKYMQGQGATNVMIMGSDDVISTDSFKRIMAEAEKGYDLIGSSDLYFFALDGIHRGGMVRLHTHRGKMLAPGKTVSSYVLDKIDWRPWTTPKNWGMDAIADKNFNLHVRARTVLHSMDIFDLKSRENLNKSTLWFGKIKEREDPAKLWNILGEEETYLLKKILL